MYLIYSPSLHLPYLPDADASTSSLRRTGGRTSKLGSAESQVLQAPEALAQDPAPCDATSTQPTAACDLAKKNVSINPKPNKDW
jgi:hypothetical protein